MTTASPQVEAPRLQNFLSGRTDDRLTDLLAFALATEAGSGTVERFRSRAAAELADHAARTMHNRIEEIRRDAVADQLRTLRRPLGFAGAMLANLLALALAGGAGFWLSTRPDLIARVTGWIGG